MAAILLMSALALDGGHMLMNKGRLQNAVDAAALSGAKTLSQVKGAVNAAELSRTAAWGTLSLNASAVGNDELGNAIGGEMADFAVVEFSNSVYGPFSFPGPTDASYVRVSVPDYGLIGFFWRFAQRFGNNTLGAKSVAAIATAGPSPTSPCDIAPLMVCGDPAQYNPSSGNFWGYQFGDLQVLKTAAGNSSAIGPGNFQLIRLPGNAGGDDIRKALAGGVEQCHGVGEQVETEPGNTVGPVVDGLNTRFGQASTSQYPADLVITANTPSLTYNDKLSPPRVEYNGLPVDSSNGNLSTSSSQLFDYLDWARDSAACIAGTGSNCVAGGVFERRILKIVVGNCTGTSSGQTSVPVLGFGCFFVLQPAEQKGNEAQIFGQFVRECEGDNVPGPNPQQDKGPQIIQLYKTYIGTGTAVPSHDS